MLPLIYIVLVNYRGLEDTLECLESLKNIDYDNYRVVVVDNESRDNSYEILKDRFSEHIIIDAKANLGFAGGNNLGIALALKEGAEYVLLLNNDTVVEPDFLSKMILCFEKHGEIGIVGGKILLYDNRDVISHAGGFINHFKYTTGHYGEGFLDSRHEFDEERDVTFVSGCLMLIKREVFERVGMLPEEYFMYYEDTDFCVQTMNEGYRIYFCPGARIYHKVSMSSGGENSPFFIKWNTRNRLIFMNKYKYMLGKLVYQLSKAYVYGTRGIRYLKYRQSGDVERATAIREGIVEGREYLSKLSE